MDDAMKRKQAETVFETICQALDANDWHYKKDQEKLKIECGARGEDISMYLCIEADADRQLVMVISPLPFTFPEDKRLDGVVAMSVVNNRLVHGCFDYDVRDGHVFFRITSTFLDSLLSKDAAMYLIMVACHTIDEYNDKFLMLSKGIIDLEKFIAAVNG